MIPVTFKLVASSGASGCIRTINPDDAESCVLAGTLERYCTVFHQDGKSVSAKQLGCSLSTLDAAGNTTAVVPLDKKVKK